MGAQGQEKIIFFWNASNWINGSKWSWWWYFLSIWTPQKKSNTLHIIKRIFALSSQKKKENICLFQHFRKFERKVLNIDLKEQRKSKFFLLYPVILMFS